MRIGLALVLGLWIALAAGCTSGRGPGDGPIGVGSPAPDFELPVVGGGTVRLSDLRGKIVFLNFWATWCPPCRDEMPSMEELKQKLPPGDFEMLAISVDEEGEAVVREFMADLPHTYKILLDPASTEDQLAAASARAYGITGVPETFVINRDGYIVEKVVGPAVWSDPAMLQFFERLINRS